MPPTTSEEMVTWRCERSLKGYLGVQNTPKSISSNGPSYMAKCLQVKKHHDHDQGHVPGVLLLLGGILDFYFVFLLDVFLAHDFSRGWGAPENITF